jgi:hypothetical protein
MTILTKLAWFTSRDQAHWNADKPWPLLSPCSRQLLVPRFMMGKGADLARGRRPLGEEAGGDTYVAEDQDRHWDRVRRRSHDVECYGRAGGGQSASQEYTLVVK